MKCPDCKHKLKSTEFTPQKRDFKTEVFYCPSCQGFLMDNIVVNSLNTADVKKLKNILKFKKKKKIIAVKERPCPVCKIELEPIKAKSIPLENSVFKCPKCPKRWFPRGELIKFKKAQKAKLNYFKEWKIPLGSVFAIVLPIFFLLTFAINLATKRQAQIFLLEPTDSSYSVEVMGENKAKISFTTSQPVKSYIEYGKTKKELEVQAISSQPSNCHQIVFLGLKPKQEYWYRIVLQDELGKVTSEFSSFTTK